VRTDLERSHDELRAALIIAGRPIQRQMYSMKAQIVLKRLRAVLKEARMARKRSCARAAGS